MTVNNLMTLAVAVCGTVMVRAVGFPNPAAFNPTWESAKPGTSYSTDLPTAALLGNGSLGAVNGGDRYNVWDSHWESSQLEKNSASALGFLKYLFSTLVDVAPALREMGVEVSEAKFAAWKDFRDHLADQPVNAMPVNGKNVRMYTSTETNVKWPTNPGGGIIFLENVIPGENYAFDITDETRTLATNGINGVIATCSPKRGCGNINQTPKLYSIAARVGYPAAAVIVMFRKYQLRPLMQKNFHLHDNVHGMEKLGTMEFIQSMFIQCDHGIVKVFPNWTGADAKFENLRAKGCFLVSSEMNDGKVVRVEVKSEKGGRFRLVDPRTARGTVPTEVGRSPRDRRSPPPGWTRGKTRNSGEATLERDFKPGEVVLLR